MENINPENILYKPRQQTQKIIVNVAIDIYEFLMKNRNKTTSFLSVFRRLYWFWFLNDGTRKQLGVKLAIPAPKNLTLTVPTLRAEISVVKNDQALLISINIHFNINFDYHIRGWAETFIG